MNKPRKSRYGKINDNMQIVNMINGKDGRTYVVVERKKGVFTSPDYAVGFGYDKKSNCWSQGYYDFSSRSKALNFAKKRAYNKFY